MTAQLNPNLWETHETTSWEHTTPSVKELLETNLFFTDHLTPADFVKRWTAPKWCWAGDKATLKRRERKSALKHASIQTNGKTVQNLIVVDFDNGNAEEELFDLLCEDQLPIPSYVTINRESGHAHIGWFLDGQARTPKQQSFFKDLRTRLTRHLSKWGADPKYTHFTTRNPLFSFQKTIWGTATRMTYNDLNDWLTKKEAEAAQFQSDSAHPVPKHSSFIETRLQSDSTSRNCDLHEQTRHYAYSIYSKLNGNGEALENAVMEYAFRRNREFNTPLDPHEVKTITSSITRWTTSHLKVFTSPQETLTERQTRRSKLAAEKRTQKAHARYVHALKLLHYGFTRKQIAEQLETSYEAVKKLLQRAKAWAGVNPFGKKKSPKPRKVVNSFKQPHHSKRMQSPAAHNSFRASPALT